MINGLILAAGESKRMGTPKALLKFDDGLTLLEKQVNLLEKAEFSNTVVVVGAHADEIKAAHPNLKVDWVVNHNWRFGQFSSIQAGIKHDHPPLHPLPSREGKKEASDGVLLLPIDVIGVSLDTIKKIIDVALSHPDTDVIIPEYHGEGGHPVYLSCEFFNWVITSLSLRKGGLGRVDRGNIRLDVLIHNSNNVIRLSVEDKNVTANINTPEEWKGC